MKTLGERISTLRKQRGLTQGQLASNLNISTSTLGMYETNKREPNISTLNALGDFFNVSVDYLIGRNDTSSASKKLISLEESPVLAYGGAESTEDDLEIIKGIIARHNRRKDN